jgi:hypothetical protein
VSWALGHAIRGDLAAQLASDLKSGGYATAAAVRRHASQAKRDLRAQFTAARMGRVANLIRSTAEPKRGPSLEAHALVFANAINKDRQIDPLAVFDEGAHVVVNGGQFLAIWQPGAGRVGVARATVAQLLPLLKKKRTARGWVLVFKARPDVIAFVLVPSATIRKHIDVDTVAAKADGISDEIAFDWERRDARAGITI